jgi:hypothetical protein
MVSGLQFLRSKGTMAITKELKAFEKALEADKKNGTKEIAGGRVDVLLEQYSELWTQVSEDCRRYLSEGYVLEGNCDNLGEIAVRENFLEIVERLKVSPCGRRDTAATKGLGDIELGVTASRERTFSGAVVIFSVFLNRARTTFRSKGNSGESDDSKTEIQNPVQNASVKIKELGDVIGVPLPPSDWSGYSDPNYKSQLERENRIRRHFAVEEKNREPL